MNLTALHTFLAEARECAQQMIENSSFIQGELPNVSLDDTLRTQTLDMCHQWRGTKYDIVSELFDLRDLIDARAKEEIIIERVHRMLGQIREDNRQMHELVMAVRSASEQNADYGLACALITESAVNVLNPFNRAKEAADLLI